MATYSFCKITKRFLECVSLPMITTPGLLLHVMLMIFCVILYYLWFSVLNRDTDITLTHFKSLIFFYTPWKHKVSDFFRFYRKKVLQRLVQILCLAILLGTCRFESVIKDAWRGYKYASKYCLFLPHHLYVHTHVSYTNIAWGSTNKPEKTTSGLVRIYILDS